MDFAFQPLELWRASSLAQETKQVIGAYERCLASQDFDGLAYLRQTIERRIDELDAFYTAHVDDERSILFDKQRLKLRKLLHEYDEAVRNSLSASAGQMSQQYLASSPQAGSAEMPEVTVPVVEKLYANVTRTNIDGRMCIRDLRQWYISYGKRALRSGVSSFDSEVVPVALVKHTKDAGPARGIKDGGRQIYSWEQEVALGASHSSSPSAAPLPLPNHVLEFQVRMTSDEYAAFASRRRQYEAELRYKERIAKGQASRVAAHKDRLAAGEEVEGGRSIFQESKYADPVSATSYVFRA